MGGRTDKQWIRQRRQQLKKQKKKIRSKWEKRFKYPKRKLSLEKAKSLGIVGAKKNPAGNTYHWYLKWRKVCWETGIRVDPNGYRLFKPPSGSGYDFKKVQLTGRKKRKLRDATTNKYTY